VSTHLHAKGSTASRTLLTRSRALACALPLLLAACADEDRSTSRSDTSGSDRGPIAVSYELEVNSEGTPLTFEVNVVSDTERVRSETDYAGRDSFDPALAVWDGKRLYLYRPEHAEKYLLFEAPDEHPDELTGLQVLGVRVGSERFARFCPGADRLAESRSVADRPAVGYQCGPGPLEQVLSTREAWFDQATGVLLEAGPFHATSITTDPELDSETFSTEPPEGAEVTVYPAKGSRYGQKAPAFELYLEEGGGSVRLSDYRGKPVVLVPFSSDLYFGPGYECPDCFPSLVTLLEMTDGGTNPSVLAIQSGEVVREGRPPAPPGVTLTLLDDPTLTIRQQYGLSMGHQMAFVFIDEQGLVRHVIDHKATREDFETGLNSIG
jgi:peroxiredoxin